MDVFAEMRRCAARITALAKRQQRVTRALTSFQQTYQDAELVPVVMECGLTFRKLRMMVPRALAVKLFEAQVNSIREATRQESQRAQELMNQMQGQTHAG